MPVPLYIRSVASMGRSISGQGSIFGTKRTWNNRVLDRYQVYSQDGFMVCTGNVLHQEGQLGGQAKLNNTVCGCLCLPLQWIVLGELPAD